MERPGRFQIANLTLTAANTEYSFTLPGGTKRYSINCRTAFAFRVSHLTGKVAGSTSPFLTIPANGVFDDSDPDELSNDILYFATSEAGVVLEIALWKHR